MRERDLPGNHCTVTVPKNVAGKLVSSPSPIIDGRLEDFSDSDLSVDSEKTAYTKASSQSSTTERLPKLLVWSAADEQATKRSIRDYELFYNEKIAGNGIKLDRLAYTLAARRTHMLWRSFAITVNDQDGTPGLDAVKPMRSSADATLAFVFTGQGAQYTGMGWDLVKYSVFADTLQRIEKIYESLGCTWSIFGKRPIP